MSIGVCEVTVGTVDHEMKVDRYIYSRGRSSVRYTMRVR
jgi:hypothetical protein